LQTQIKILLKSKKGVMIPKEEEKV